MAFTNKFIQALQAKRTPYREWEGNSDPGFGVQVTPTAAKTFFFFYRFQGKRRFMHLGRYPEISLAEAREACRKGRSLLEQNVDPQEHQLEKQHAKQVEKALALQKQQEEEIKGSLQQLFDSYISNLKSEGKKSYREVDRALKRDALQILPPNMKAKEVQPHHIKLILHEVINRGSLIAANRLRSYLSAAFRFGIEHDNDPKNMKTNVLFFLEMNPVRDVPKPKKQEQPAIRDLSANEIYQLWNELPKTDMTRPMQLALMLILATGGQRVSEILEAEWKEFDFDKRLWEIPPHRTKNKRVHLIPLTTHAIKLLSEVKTLNGNLVYLFPKQASLRESKTHFGPCMPLASISRSIARFCERTKFEKFTPRDLRRTCKTRMGEIGLSKEIRDRIHNHALGDVSAKHYDRYDYLPEKRKALERWERWLSAVIHGTAGKTPVHNVVQLKSVVA